ncbi:MAG: serine protease, partial [Pirellulaceae bacterium]|nr:serine protease [Pirellulaceae bacterium]
VTTFRASGPSITNEAQAGPGDSGGAVFNSAGELIGTIYVREFVNTAQLSGNHQEKILYGEKTWIADLSAYSSQISLIQAVPEPSTWGLAIIGIMGVVVLVKVNRREAVLGE